MPHGALLVPGSPHPGARRPPRGNAFDTAADPSVILTWWQLKRTAWRITAFPGCRTARRRWALGRAYRGRTPGQAPAFDEGPGPTWRSWPG